jgi:hypothetical protein
MAKSLQKIRQELESLETQSTELATELDRLYRHYLQVLSQSTKNQFILACYQICTQIYPESFLKLSFNQREKLQEKFRHLYGEIQGKFFAYLDASPVFTPPQPTLTEQILLRLSPHQEPSFKVTESNEKLNISEINNPEVLVHWCQRVEEGIRETLNHLSQEANNYLQEANIISSNLPPQILQMALQAEEAGVSTGNSPNILNLLVERKTNQENANEDDEDDNEKEEKITKISAINLRLSEIEFADTTLSIERKEIRSCLEKLKKMRKYYQLTQQEYAQAEAESAWRSSWHE